MVLGDSQGIWELSFQIKENLGQERVVMLYPREVIDFIKDRLEVAQGSRGVIIHVEGHSIRNRDGHLKGQKYYYRNIYRELLVRGKEIRKKVCVNRILPRLGENKECGQGH